MLSLIKIIIIIYIMLTSNKVLTIKSDKPDLNIPENKPELNIPDDPNADGISILAIILLQLSFYVFVHYLDYRLFGKCKGTDVDKVDDTHKEEQHENDIDN